MGGRVAGCTRWKREGKTESRSKTWVAPESARIGGIGGAGSLHGRGEFGRTSLHKHASIAMVPTISGWPPVSGHPAMVVAIEMQFRRAQERSAWKGSVKGACLLCLWGLIAWLAFLLASLSIARLV